MTMAKEFSRQYEIKNLDKLKLVLGKSGYNLGIIEGREDIYKDGATELGAAGNIRSGTKWMVVTAFSEIEGGKGLQKLLIEFED